MAGGDRRAEIEIDVKGAERAAAAARSALSPWTEHAGKATAAFKSFGQEVKSAVGGVVSDLGRIATVGAAINLRDAITSVHAVEAAMSKLAVGTKRDFSAVRDEVNGLATKLAMTPEQVASYIGSVGKGMYSFEGAKRDMAAFAALAAETGRDIGEEAGLSKALAGMGVEDQTKALNELRGVVDQIKPTGGIAALVDQFTAMQGTLMGASNTVPQLMAALGGFGKGLPEQQARQVQQTIAKEFAPESARAWEYRYKHLGKLGGKSLIDKDTGEFDVVRAMQLRQAELRAMSPEKGLAVAQQEFGTIAGARFYRQAIEQSTGKQIESDALVRRAATPEGQRAAVAAANAVSAQGMIGADSALGKIQTYISTVASAHPGIAIAVQSMVPLLTQIASGKLGGGGIGAGNVVSGGVAAGKAISAASSSAASEALAAGVGALAPVAAVAGIAAFQAKAMLSLKVDPKKYREEAAAATGAYGAGMGGADALYRQAEGERIRKLSGAFSGAREELEETGKWTFRKRAGEELMATAESGASPVLKDVLEKLQSGAMSEDQANAIADAISKGTSAAKMEIVVNNYTGGPVTAQPGGEQ